MQFVALSRRLGCPATEGAACSVNRETGLRRPGIEPGSTAWKAAMLTTIPPSLRVVRVLLPTRRFFEPPRWRDFTSRGDCHRLYKEQKRAAMAGNRTRVNCLEGSYAHHYTTIATEGQDFTAKSALYISVEFKRERRRKRGEEDGNIPSREEKNVLWHSCN